MTTKADDQEVRALQAGKIELDFVPVWDAAAAPHEFGDELVLVNSHNGSIHVLNETGAVVWKCFDGQGTLAEISKDIAEAFHAPQDRVEEDVLGLTRWMGEAGLLEGVVRTEEDLGPDGRDVGDEIPPFVLPSLDGPRRDLRDLRGSQVLLLNWSPYCGYCERIVPELALVHPALEAKGVRMVLVSAGDEGDNRTLLSSHDLSADLLLKPAEPIEGFEDPFPGMGTPAAYLLDADGRVAAPLAMGAVEVPALANQVAGLLPITAPPSEDARDHAGHGHQGGPADEGGAKYLPGAGGFCGPDAKPARKPRTWAATAVYGVGEYHVGVRADSAATDELLARVFPELRLADETRAPDNYSVVLEDTGRGTRGLSLLLDGDITVVRSRSRRRVMLALATRFSELLAPPDDLLRTRDVATLIDGEVVLLPEITVNWLDKTQGRLAGLGVRLSDEPSSAIDTERLELVVPEPIVPFDRAVVDSLAAPFSGRSELPPIEPGRYPLRTWAVDFDEEEGRFTTAQAISAAWRGMAAGQGDSSELVDRIAALFARLDVVPLPFDGPDELVRSVHERILVAS